MDRLTRINNQIEVLRTEFVELCKRLDAIKDEISKLSIESYEIEFGYAPNYDVDDCEVSDGTG